MDKKVEMLSDDILQDEWLIRPCMLYKDEYSDCRSIRARFHQYFIFGETLDCTQWKRDFDNCSRWIKSGDMKSRNSLIESERARRETRLLAHYNNNIWKKRDKPPNDWNKPLPEWMEKRHENSALAVTAKEFATTGDISEIVMPAYNFCNIL